MTGIWCWKLLLNGATPAAPSTQIDLAIWKVVIIIGVVAIVAFYFIKRIADIFVDRKTASIIRDLNDDASPPTSAKDDDETK